MSYYRQIPYRNGPPQSKKHSNAPKNCCYLLQWKYTLTQNFRLYCRVGAVLAHKMPDGSERPVGFASRTLSNTEKGYSQIEKEGLSCIFGITRYHAYLIGRYFTLITDHKPLLSLLNEHKPIPSHASAHIQRWALTLAAYEYTLVSSHMEMQMH